MSRNHFLFKQPLIRMLLKIQIPLFSVVLFVNLATCFPWQLSPSGKYNKRGFSSLSYSKHEYDSEGKFVVLGDTYSSHSRLRRVSPFEKAIQNDPSPIFKMLTIASLREERGEPVLNFSVGNPTLEPPRAVLESMAKIAAYSCDTKRKGIYKYTNPSGLVPLREHIAAEVGNWQQTPSLSANNVILTPGAQSGIVNTLQTLLIPGDTVLIQTPFYPDFMGMVDLWGCNAEKIRFDGDFFDLDLQSIVDLAQEAGNRLRVILLCSPSNPTGKILDTNTIEKVVRIASQHSQKYKRDVWLVMDHTYWRISYNNHVPSTFPLYKSVLLISSFSKDMSLAGERIGYVTINPMHPSANQLAECISQNNGRLGNISPPSLIQHALLDTYQVHGFLPTLMEQYKKRVMVMHKGLMAAGMTSCYMPDGAFYLFPRLPDGIDDYEFAESLAHHGVLVIPGSEFGAPGYLRFAALERDCVMEEAFLIVKKLLLHYQDEKI